MWLKNRDNCKSWKPIGDLLLNTDEATFQYVLRQLCRRIGNKKFLVRGRVHKAQNTMQVEREKLSQQVQQIQKMQTTMQGITKRLSILKPNLARRSSIAPRSNSTVAVGEVQA
jgi:hypothetical protein